MGLSKEKGLPSLPATTTKVLQNIINNVSNKAQSASPVKDWIPTV